jgi:hypothetical protein
LLRDLSPLKVVCFQRPSTTLKKWCDSKVCTHDKRVLTLKPVDVSYHKSDLSELIFVRLLQSPRDYKLFFIGFIILPFLAVKLLPRDVLMSFTDHLWVLVSSILETVFTLFPFLHDFGRIVQGVTMLSTDLDTRDGSYLGRSASCG